jgi:hypothetical protein
MQKIPVHRYTNVKGNASCALTLHENLVGCLLPSSCLKRHRAGKWRLLDSSGKIILRLKCTAFSILLNESVLEKTDRATFKNVLTCPGSSQWSLQQRL